jgi:hypothetical protein
MSNRDRLLVAAAALGVVFCSLIWSAVGLGLLTRNPERAAAESEIYHQRQHDQYETYDAALALTDEACAEARTESADESQRHDNRDLCAQYIAAASARKSANYTQFQTWIGLFGFSFVIVGLILNWVATDAAAEQARLARRAIPQPYLQVSPKQLRLASEADRAGAGAILRSLPQHDSAQFTLHNHGGAPATLVHVQARLDLVEAGDPFPGFVTNDPVEPNMLVHGVIVGANGESDPLWASRQRVADTFPDVLDDWWLHGYVVYSDGFDRYYALGFCFGFAGFGFVRATPPGCRNGDANYHREITKKKPRFLG